MEGVMAEERVVNTVLLVPSGMVTPSPGDSQGGG